MKRKWGQNYSLKMQHERGQNEDIMNVPSFVHFEEQCFPFLVYQEHQILYIDHRALVRIKFLL